MKYIRERPDNYQNWEDDFIQIQGLEFENREKIRSRYIQDIFTTNSGEKLIIELPPQEKLEFPIVIENEESGEYWEVSKQQFERILDLESYVLSVDQLT